MLISTSTKWKALTLVNVRRPRTLPYTSVTIVLPQLCRSHEHSARGSSAKIRTATVLVSQPTCFQRRPGFNTAMPRT
jgi:hypothetical protein